MSSPATTTTTAPVPRSWAGVVHQSASTSASILSTTSKVVASVPQIARPAGPRAPLQFASPPALPPSSAPAQRGANRATQQVASTADARRPARTANNLAEMTYCPSFWMQQRCQKHEFCRKVRCVVTSTKQQKENNDADLKFTMLGRTHCHPRLGLSVAKLVYEAWSMEMHEDDHAVGAWIHESNRRHSQPQSASSMLPPLPDHPPTRKIHEWNWLLGLLIDQGGKGPLHGHLLTAEHLASLSPGSTTAVCPIWSPPGHAQRGPITPDPVACSVKTN